jgi:hypothetical protein
MEVVVVGIGGEGVAIERWKETRRRVADMMMRFVDYGVRDCKVRSRIECMPNIE